MRRGGFRVLFVGGESTFIGGLLGVDGEDLPRIHQWCRCRDAEGYGVPFRQQDIRSPAHCRTTSAGRPGHEHRRLVSTSRHRRQVVWRVTPLAHFSGPTRKSLHSRARGDASLVPISIGDAVAGSVESGLCCSVVSFDELESDHIAGSSVKVLWCVNILRSTNSDLVRCGVHERNSNGGGDERSGQKRHGRKGQ